MKPSHNLTRLSCQELRNRLDAGERLLLIDTLPPAHHQQKRLPGAANACVFEVDFLDQVTNLGAEPEQPILLYGAGPHTHDAHTAGEKLLRAGYRKINILEGGLQAWRDAGNPLEGNGVDREQTPKFLGDGQHRIDLEDSRIFWLGRNPGSSHDGMLRLSSGEVRIEGRRIEGSFEIDMTSIETLDLAGDKMQPVLEDHLKSDDFFFVKHFPKATFSLVATPTREPGPASAPNYQVNGSLNLRGISAEQNFPATILPLEDGRIVAEAHFDIDRTRWGVIYGSTRFFEHLGMHLVFDPISIQLRIFSK